MVIKIIFNFGERKVQKVRYTFLIPLPTIWAKNAKLDQSSSVNIELMDDGSIRITPSSTGPARSERVGCASPI
jgi:antitoxin component of MazEF toxin-antitoxin module